ncbi:hypothetical protein ACFSTC_56370 [Nonomuraea ferruginea]
MEIEGSFWRAIAVYRVASLVYAALLLATAAAATSVRSRAGSSSV